MKKLFRKLLDMATPLEARWDRLLILGRRPAFHHQFTAVVLAGFALGTLSLVRATEQAAPIATQISPANPGSLQEGIESAFRAGQKKVVVPPGTYRLAHSGNRACLIFSELSDFEIDARGVTLLRTDPTRGGIEFNRCRNVTLRGATLLNETPPFTQGTLTGISPDGAWYEVRMDKGYPANFDDPRTGIAQPVGYLFDPKTRQWKAGAMDCFFGRVERLGPDLFRLFFKKPFEPGTQPAVVGDWMAFRGKGGTDIHLGGCARMVVTNVTILNGGGFCVHEQGGEGGNYYSYQVTYGPKPSGATNEPLIACNADAFHSGGVRKGPTLENCLFEGMCDDGVPIHGSFALVMEGAGD
jgi:hypothetical protein